LGIITSQNHDFQKDDSAIFTKNFQKGIEIPFQTGYNGKGYRKMTEIATPISVFAKTQNIKWGKIPQE
jgi:hypothetical protein